MQGQAQQLSKSRKKILTTTYQPSLHILNEIHALDKEEATLSMHGRGG